MYGEPDGGAQCSDCLFAWSHSRRIWSVAGKGPIFPVIVAGESVYVSGLPPFDPDTGEIKRLPFKRQADIVLDQMKRCVEAVGLSLDRVVKCNVYCTPVEAHFGEFNEVYASYFPVDSPARIFVHVPSWPGPFDIEVDCIAVL